MLSMDITIAVYIAVSSLRLLAQAAGGTGRTAVTAGLPRKEIFAFGSNNTGRNLTEF